MRGGEKLAAVKFKQANPAFKKFAISRPDVDEDKFVDKVGSQFIPTVYHGKAVYQSSGAPIGARCICLHTGVGNGAVRLYAAVTAAPSAAAGKKSIQAEFPPRPGGNSEHRSIWSMARRNDPDRACCAAAQAENGVETIPDGRK